MKTNLDQIKQISSLELLAHQLVEGFITGLHKSPYHGFSVEFAEHKLYNEGESTRHVDWKIFARTDRLFTKRYEEETNLRCLVVLDTSASMHYPVGGGKLKFSVYAAAALSFLLHKQRDAVGLCVFNDKIETLTPVKSSGTHLNKIFTLLEKLQNQPKPTAQTQVAKVLHEVAEKIHKRSLVVIFSDMFDAGENTDELFKALQHLKHNKHEVVVFHVMDNHTEFEFEFEDRPIEFIDLESGDRLKLNPCDVKESYRQKINQFHQSLKMRCHQYKIDFVESDINNDFKAVLQTYLIKRAKML